MKKIFALILALMIASAIPAMAEMTGDEIIAKHIEAYGGAKAMSDVKTMTMKGSMFAQGMPLDLAAFMILPDKSYMAVSTNNMVLYAGGTNGKEAWATQMGQTFILEGKEKADLETQAEQFTLLDYKKKGGTAKFLGEDLVKGAKAYKVEYVSAEHETTTYFFDAANYYIVREKSARSNTSYSNHKAVSGIVFPFKINSQVEMGGQSAQQMLTIDSIEINVPIADSLFVMPKNAQPMPKAPAPADTGAAPAEGSGK